MANDKHPDAKAGTPVEYSDTYSFNTYHFDTSDGNAERYARRDMLLVIGGGYHTDTVDEVKFKFTKL